MHEFLIITLKKILNEAGRRHGNLKSACKDCLAILQSGEVLKVTKDDNEQPLILPTGEKWHNFAKQLLDCFRWATVTDKTKIVSPTISCLEKLLALGYLKDLKLDENRDLADVAIELICECFNPKVDDEHLQLQIVKSCRTIVATPHVPVHQSTLLNVVRTVYNVYLKAKSNETQANVKASLQQILEIVFQSLPASTANDDQSTLPPLTPATSAHNVSSSVAKEKNDDNNNDDNNAEEIVVNKTEEVNDAGDQATLTDEESNVAESSEEQDSSSTASTTAEPATQPPAAPTTTVKSSSTVSKPATEPKRRTSMFSSIVDALSGGGSAQHEPTSKSQWGNDLKLPPGDVSFTDCFLLFRALCKLSLKGVDMEAQDPFKSKILALEMLACIVDNCGDRLMAAERFVDAVMPKYLSLSLIKNCVSPVPRVFQLTATIARHVLTKFKTRLKTQCGVLWSTYARLLSSSNSLQAQKMGALQLISHVCRKPQAVVEIFLNYDCDVDGKDVFEQIVKAVARAAGTVNNPTLMSAGLDCLELLLAVLVRWVDECGALQQAQQHVSDVVEGDAEDEDADNDGHDDMTPRWLSTPDAAQIEKFRRAKDHKLMMDEGRVKFALSHKKGLAYFLSAGLIENTPDSIADFLRSTPGLDLTQVGELIGGAKELNKAILHRYVDSFDFTDMDLDVALRKFLFQFRIPGEAAIIDRILEKFAERYFAQNSKTIFQSADTAYVMSFSIMMLSTDLHSKAQAQKMTREEWLENNRKYIPGLKENWDEEYMIALFDRIAAEPFQLHGQPTTDTINVSGPLAGQMAFMVETQELVKSAQAAIKNTKGGEYHIAHQAEHAQAMLRAAAFPALAPLSMLLDDQSTAPAIVAQCLICFEHAILIACLFAMDTERTTFVSTLTKFTHLHTDEPLTPKDVACIRALMKIAHQNANFLQTAWTPVLRCVSQLERLRLSENVDRDLFRRPFPREAQHVANDSVEQDKHVGVDANDNERNASKSSSNASRASLSPTATRRAAATVPLVAPAPTPTLPTYIDMDEIDRFFTRSVHLTGNAILDFVSGVCDVSREEINDSHEPRFFCMVKLVVVAEYNMNRIRWVWSRVWRILANHFETAGCHANVKVAMHAIDSLRQLSKKFLEKDELANYSFQKEFLRPFERIIVKRPALETRDFVIRCVSQMIDARANNIKSGWKSIFAVFRAAASDPEEAIVALAFAKVETIMKKYFPMIAELFFVDCVSCLAAYGNNNLFKDIGLKAISSLEYCAAQLVSGQVVELESTPSDDGNTYLFTDSDRHMAMWFPILTGLAAIIAHPHIDVRTAALRALFALLREHGSNFSPGLWRVVFPGVLMPIFDSVRYAGGDASPEDEEWLNTTCLDALRSLVELVQLFCDSVDFLVSDLLRLLAGCMLQGNESLAEIGATSLLQFIVSSAGRLPTREWVIIIERIDEIVAANGVSLRTALSDELGVKFNEVTDDVAVGGDDAAGQSLDQPDSNTVVNETDEIVENNNETKANDDDNNVDEQTNDNDNNDSNNNINDNTNIDDTNNSDNNNNDDDDENEKENDVEQQTSSEIETQPKPVLESVPSTPSNIKFAEADEDKAVFSVKSTLKVHLLMIEAIKTIVTSQFEHLGEQRATSLLDTLLNVRQQTGELRQIVGAHVLNTSRDARNDAVSNQSTSSAMAGASHRPVLALERLEAAAAQAGFDCALSARSSLAAKQIDLGRCERFMLLRSIRDTADAFGSSPTPSLGETASIQFKYLSNELPDESAKRHLATLHSIGAACVAAASNPATVRTALDLMVKVVKLAGVQDELIEK